MNKKRIISMLFLVAWATTLPAQITRDEADSLVKAYLQSENVVYNILYVNTNTPNAAGIVITTSQQEVVKASYACWTYYLNDSERSQCRYLFVKEDNGNLLEVIASNDLGQSDLTQWETLDNVGIVETGRAPSLPQIYPNPTTGQLIVEIAGQVRNDVQEVEIHDIMGRLVQSEIVNLQSKIEIDISHFPAGIYYLSLYGEKRVIYKVVKQ